MTEEKAALLTNGLKNTQPNCDFGDSGTSTSTGTNGTSANQSSVKAQFKTYLRRLKGIFFAVLSATCFCLSVTFVKVTGNLHTYEVTLFRLGTQAILGIPALVYSRKEIKVVFENRKTLILLIIASVLFSLAFFCQYFAIEAISMGDATAIIFSSPIIVTLLSCVFLKERFTLADFIIVIVTVTGCLFVAHPKFLFGSQYMMTQKRLLGLISAILACTLLSSVYVILRELKYVNPTIIVFVVGLLGSGISLIFCLISGILLMPTQDQWFELFAMGILGYGGQVFITYAFKYEKAGLVTVIRGLDIILSFSIEAILFHNPPGIWSIVGAIMVFGGGLVAALKTMLTSNENAESPRDIKQAEDIQDKP